MRTTEGQLEQAEALDDEKLIAMYNQQLIVKRAHEKTTCTHAADAKHDRDRAFTSLLDDLADAYRARGKYRDAMRCGQNTVGCGSEIGYACSGSERRMWRFAERCTAIR